MQVETSREARQAALAATRQMMQQDEFSALVGALVDCNAVPRAIMGKALKQIADGMIAKARGELETGVALYPAELFERARSLDSHAAMLLGA